MFVRSAFLPTESSNENSKKKRMHFEVLAKRFFFENKASWERLRERTLVRDRLSEQDNAVIGKKIELKAKMFEVIWSSD